MKLPRLPVLAYLAAVGALFFNTQPVLVTAFMSEWQLDAGEVGLAIGVGLLGAVIVFGACFAWSGKLAFRSMTLAGLVLGLVALASLALPSSLTGVTGVLFLLGVGSGLVYAPVMIALGRSSQPARDFAIAITTQVLIAGGLLVLVPAVVVPAMGFPGILVVFGIIFAVGLLAALGSGAIELTGGPGLAATRNTTAWLTILAMAIYFVGLNGVWAFLDLMGAARGFTPTAVGAALTLSVLAGVAGTLLASRFDRLSPRTAMLISFVVFTTFIGVLLVVPGYAAFVVALVLFNIGWNFSLPYLMALTAVIDESGRFLALLPAAQALGGAMGPIVAGVIMTSLGSSAAIWQLLVSVMLAFAVYAMLLQPAASGDGL